MIRFEWRLDEEMTVQDIGDVTDVVTQFWFQCVAIDTETGREQGIHGSLTPPTDGLQDGFVAYDDLTQDVVIGWIEALPTAQEFRDAAEAALLEQTRQPRLAPWANG